MLLCCFGARSVARFLSLVFFVVASAPALGAQAASDTTLAAKDSARSLERVTVRAFRADHNAPVSHKTLTQEEIEQRLQGQDIPVLLQGTPSLTLKSETGTNWGYSYIRLRGMEHRRLNFTLDGIPLNDPEDHVLYFADFPDLANSVGSIQVQRGVGTSSAGVASYAGSVHLESVPLARTPRAFEVQLQAGSFDARRASVEYSSGLLPSGFALYARGSALTTDGYRHHAGIDGRSAFVSAGYFGARDVVKLTFTAGVFADTLAYTGATLAQLAADRRVNPLRPDETDRFGEQLAALSYTRALGVNSSLATTLYRVSAAGNYEVCIDRCEQPLADLWNFNLDFVWYGLTSAWSYDRDRLRVTAGVNANDYARDHYAFARPNMSQHLYFNTGHKNDISGFGKVAFELGSLTIFGDVQGRYARFRYDPDRQAGISAASTDWTFLNPKAGVTYRASDRTSVYASYGVHTREPSREDMFGGFDNLDTTNVAFVGGLTRVRPERVYNVEAGVRTELGDVTVGANVFDMRFRNEILPIGELSYIGTPLRKNVRSSYRRGIEVDAAAQVTPRLSVSANATFMTSQIAEYADRDGTTYRNVPALLTPSFMSSHTATWQPMSSVSLSLLGSFVGRSQLTNTNDPTLMLPSTYVLDGRIQFTRGKYSLTLFGNNLGGSNGYSTGNVSSSGEPRYFVLAPPNVQALLRMVF